MVDLLATQDMLQHSVIKKILIKKKKIMNKKYDSIKERIKYLLHKLITYHLFVTPIKYERKNKIQSFVKIRFFIITRATLPVFTNFVNKHDAVRLSHSNLCGIRRKCQSFNDIALFSSLFYFNKQYTMSLIDRIKSTYFIVYTWELAGFVANLSRFSPISSKSITTLSIVTTANFWLLADQAMAVTLHAPS